MSLGMPFLPASSRNSSTVYSCSDITQHFDKGHYDEVCTTWVTLMQSEHAGKYWKMYDHYKLISLSGEDYKKKPKKTQQ